MSKYIPFMEQRYGYKVIYRNGLTPQQHRSKYWRFRVIQNHAAWYYSRFTHWFPLWLCQWQLRKSHEFYMERIDHLHNQMEEMREAHKKALVHTAHQARGNMSRAYCALIDVATRQHPQCIHFLPPKNDAWIANTHLTMGGTRRYPTAFNPVRQELDKLHGKAEKAHRALFGRDFEHGYMPNDSRVAAYSYGLTSKVPALPSLTANETFEENEARKAARDKNVVSQEGTKASDA